MRKIIENYITLSVALVGFIGGGIWVFQSESIQEPLILVIGSLITIVGFFILKAFPENNTVQNKTPTTSIKKEQNINNNGNVNKQININENQGRIQM